MPHLLVHGTTTVPGTRRLGDVWHPCHPRMRVNCSLGISDVDADCTGGLGADQPGGHPIGGCGPCWTMTHGVDRPRGPQPPVGEVYASRRWQLADGRAGERAAFGGGLRLSCGPRWSRRPPRTAAHQGAAGTRAPTELLARQDPPRYAVRTCAPRGAAPSVAYGSARLHNSPPPPGHGAENGGERDGGARHPHSPCWPRLLSTSCSTAPHASCASFYRAALSLLKTSIWAGGGGLTACPTTAPSTATL